MRGLEGFLILICLMAETQATLLYQQFQRNENYSTNVHQLTRDIDIAVLSVCLSVMFRYCIKTTKTA